MINVQKTDSLSNEIRIFAPIKIKKSNVYGLVFTDSSGKTHYFNEDGSYDGWSRDCNCSLN